MEIEHINQHHRFFQDVIALGKKHSQTLGFMPEGGFIDHARKKYIIVAHSGTELIGYLMFRLVVRYSSISIVHLCVTEESRGHGVPTKLLDELRRKYEATYMGISLSCRADYFHATELWKRYGFVCKGQVRSRSIDENYLYKWWYDFNKPDLFSGVKNSTTLKVKALLDANIILKLRDNDIEFEPSQDPRSLMADWLVDEVDYFYAPELLNEITRDKNYDRAEKTRTFLRNFTVVRFDIEKYKDISNQLKAFIPGNTENDKSDRKQLATSIVTKIPFFVTLDRGILEKRDEIENNFKLQVFSPHEFIIEIDQLVNNEEYSPARLAGLTFHSIAKVSKSELDIYIDQFLFKSESERKISFKISYMERLQKSTFPKLR
jgi:predicted nucleic acid-binding protein/GNAT superfamily N-acetyltransferase